MLAHVRAMLDVFSDPLPVFLGPLDRLWSGGCNIDGVVGLATQDDRVDHYNLKRHVRVGNREL